ncbi:uncharacterized protein LOC130986631 isoform X2 [Salvia miltiorrhiza]|uniref:uncharacterized protein LOC130986631 isoform X2 n=1 Tax=Salvia miltiorrhiza TaxID=226208 RepID=UPI0025AC683B|nr:uncharacterized protein LOC130986631 isoform X2 [Salvia miltiorrhiza]
MGQSSSTEQGVSPELRQVQSLAASTGALPSLQKSFPLLSNPQTQSIPIASLQKCFDLTCANVESGQDAVLKELPLLFSHLGSAIVDLFFVADKNGVNEIEFLRGYTNICGRAVASTLLNNLLRVFSVACSKAGLQVDLQFELFDDNCKISGALLPRDVHMLLCICWIFVCDSRMFRLNAGKSEGKFSIPDISHLVFSAIEECGDRDAALDFWDSTASELDIQLPAAKIHLWALKNVPNLADCFQLFVHARLCYLTAPEEKSEPSCSSAHESSSSAISEIRLLTPGRAWAISLSLRGAICEELSKACLPCDDYDTDENLLYQSSVDGKGLNRFWSRVGGYNGPSLILISACEQKSNARPWIIGALTDEGFENKDIYYGTSGSLYAISPVFHAFLSSGREKNFVYSHSRGRAYEAKPKPVGIGFGGTLGNERIFLDDDFARVTVRHHAIDKTYQHGNLFPNQGFLPTEASVFQVEVWGLGGRSAREVQASYQKREEIFTDQRRKIDLKTFTNWEDSPEKMMMDMVSNPNTVRREER